MPVTALTEAQVADIVTRRQERGALTRLQLEYHIGSKRVISIWKEHGVFDRHAPLVPTKPLAPDSTKVVRAGLTKKELRGRPFRSSAAGRYQVEEPTGGAADGELSLEQDQGAEDDPICDNPPDALSEKIRTELGSVEAGNNAPAADLRRDLSTAVSAGGISRSEYSRLQTEAAESVADNNKADAQVDLASQSDSATDSDADEDSDAVGGPQAPPSRPRPQRQARLHARGRGRGSRARGRKEELPQTNRGSRDNLAVGRDRGRTGAARRRFCRRARRSGRPADLPPAQPRRGDA